MPTTQQTFEAEKEVEIKVLSDLLINTGSVLYDHWHVPLWQLREIAEAWAPKLHKAGVRVVAPPA